MNNVDIYHPMNAEKVFDLIDITDTTKNDYKYRIRYFLEFIQTRGLNINTFRDYKRHLANRIDIATATKNKYLNAARIWLKEIYRNGLIKQDLTTNTKGFRQDKKHKRVGINESEMQTIITKLKSLATSPDTARLRAIVSLLALQGLRQIEIIRLDVTDVDLNAGISWIQGKGRDDKEIIYLHPETIKALRHYLDITKIKSGALFISNSNRAKNQRLTTRGLRKIITELLKELGIKKTVHGFRHYFVSTLIRSYKGDVLEVSRYTRHRSIEMLQVYNDNIKLRADLPRFYSAFNYSLQ